MKIYYHNDLDGRASAFAVYAWACLASGREAEFFPMNYDRPFPLDDVKEREEVWIVDYSIEPEEMVNLLECTPNVRWVDHHQTSIEKYQDFPYSVPGVRQNGEAACVLTWRFLQGEVPLPIRLIGDRDVWKWEFGDMTDHFWNGLACYDTSPQSPIWWQVLGRALVPGQETDFFQQVLDEGKVVSRFRKQWYKEIRESIAFETTFEGYKCIAVNMPKVGSEIFGGRDLPSDHDIFISFYHDGKQFTVSLTSKTVDVAKIAEKYGGGGHRGAAGYTSKELPFKGDVDGVDD